MSAHARSVLFVAVIGGLSAMGCQRDRRAIEPAPPPASTSARAAVYGPLVDFSAFAEHAERACQPARDVISIDDMKIQHSAMNECLRERLVTERQRMLRSPGAGRSAHEAELTREERAFDAFAHTLAEVRESLMWIVLEEGTYTEGSGIGTGQLTCETSALLERLYFVAARAIGSVSMLATRVRALEKRGEASRATFPPVHGAAKRWSAPGATPEIAPESMERPMDPASWIDLDAQVRKVEAGASALAATTCRTWSEAAEALGGGASCEAKMTLYYFGHCEKL